jgi:hypothetical protein
LIERHRSAEAFQFRGLVDDRGGVDDAADVRIRRLATVALWLDSRFLEAMSPLAAQFGADLPKSLFDQ